MIFAAFVGMFFVPGGTSSWVPLVNVFVHAIMYSYYLLSIIRPEYKKSIQMKKTLTQIQMVIGRLWTWKKNFHIDFFSVAFNLGPIHLPQHRLHGNSIDERLQISQHTSCCLWCSMYRHVHDVLRILQASIHEEEAEKFMRIKSFLEYFSVS